MRFGNLPHWALELSNYIRDALFFNEHESVTMDVVSSNGKNQIHSLPFDVWRREPLFDQLIVNVYQPGEVSCFLELRVESVSSLLNFLDQKQNDMIKYTLKLLVLLSVWPYFYSRRVFDL